jgi:hypothetical protein
MKQTNQGFAASRKTAFQFKGQANGSVIYLSGPPTTPTVSLIPTCPISTRTRLK